MLWRQGGAPLDAPADPGSQDYPARPEWYFLSLFQMLKKFPGKYEFVGTQVVPGAIVAVLSADASVRQDFPSQIRPFPRLHIRLRAGRRGRLSDRRGTPVGLPRPDRSRRAATRPTQAPNARCSLARRSPDAGIPPSGAGDLLNRDPLTRGMALLEQKCLGCHAYEGQDASERRTARYKGFELDHFASREWLGEFLDNPSAAEVRRSSVPTAPGANLQGRWTGMDQVEEDLRLRGPGRARRRRRLRRQLSAEIPADGLVEDWAADPRVKDHPGFAPFVEKCLPCHAVGNLGPSDKELRAPGLFAYGSSQWLGRMIKNPAERGLYGFKKAHEQMPGFADQLTPNELEMLVRLLRDDYVKAPEPREAAIRP